MTSNRDLHLIPVKAASASTSKNSSWSNKKRKKKEKSRTTHVSIFPENVTRCACSSGNCLSNSLVIGQCTTSECKFRSQFIKWVPIFCLNILRTKQINRLVAIYAAYNLPDIGQSYFAEVLNNKMSPSHREYLLYLTFCIRNILNFSIQFLIWLNYTAGKDMQHKCFLTTLSKLHIPRINTIT